MEGKQRNANTDYLLSDADEQLLLNIVVRRTKSLFYRTKLNHRLTTAVQSESPHQIHRHTIFRRVTGPKADQTLHEQAIAWFRRRRRGTGARRGTGSRIERGGRERGHTREITLCEISERK